MSPTIEEANAALRDAVEQRLEAQAEGKPHEAWYSLADEPEREAERYAEVVSRWNASRNESDAVQVVTEPMHLQASDEDLQRPGSLPFLELLEELRTLHLSKSQDYGSESDPLANIRQGADFVNIEPWRGCCVRIADKVQRLRTFCRTGRLVHEGVRDTLLDLAAYSLLAIVLFDEGRDA